MLNIFKKKTPPPSNPNVGSRDRRTTDTRNTGRKNSRGKTVYDKPTIKQSLSNIFNSSAEDRRRWNKINEKSGFNARVRESNRESSSASKSKPGLSPTSSKSSSSVTTKTPPQPSPLEMAQSSYFNKAADLFGTTARISRGMYDAWQENFIPTAKKVRGQYDRLVSVANDYLTPGRIALNEGQAATDVANAYSTQRGVLGRQLGRFGLNPGSGSYSAALRSLALGEAAGKAGARTTARQRTQEIGTNLIDRTVGLGSGLGQMFQGIGAQAGQLATQSGMGLANLGDTLLGADLTRDGFEVDRERIAAGLEGNRNVVNEQAKNRRTNTLGTLLGFGLSLFSDARMKTNVETIGYLPDGLRVVDFRFLHNETEMFTGVIAQEVQEKYPHLVEMDESGFLKVNYEGLIERQLQ